MLGLVALQDSVECQQLNCYRGFEDQGFLDRFPGCDSETETAHIASRIFAASPRRITRLQLYKSQLDSCSPEEAHLGQGMAGLRFCPTCRCQDTKTEMEPAAGNGGKAPKTETSAAPTPKEGDLKDKDMKEVEKEVDNEAQAEAAKESTAEVAEGHAVFAFSTQVGNAGPVGKQQSAQSALLGALRLVRVDVGKLPSPTVVKLYLARLSSAPLLALRRQGLLLNIFAEARSSPSLTL